MARTNSSRRWYLFDYGNVISTPPTREDWEVLAEATGVPSLQESTSPYWQHRYAYDAGALTSDEYWSLVCGERTGPARAAWLDVLDGNQWSHPNLDTLDVLEDLDAQGEHLALLSNMPAAMVSQLGDAAWARLFEHRFFSSSLGLVKPSAAIFEHVLTALSVEPGLVTFVDDAPANIATARSLGIDARLFDASLDLSRMLAREPAGPPRSAQAAGVAAGMTVTAPGVGPSRQE
ncbi:HAD family phosphatase [Arthrobacter sp. B1805]|uniref:HAD family hydrolase n=1 Tax=Arthrobacter sp. B1805 TaxID=2058892 RepID=UPI000CE53867|nr:HAD family phosphatase [Arthrobacter sp. B1805]